MLPLPYLDGQEKKTVPLKSKIMYMHFKMTALAFFFFSELLMSKTTPYIYRMSNSWCWRNNRAKKFCDKCAHESVMESKGLFNYEKHKTHTNKDNVALPTKQTTWVNYCVHKHHSLNLRSQFLLRCRSEGNYRAILLVEKSNSKISNLLSRKRRRDDSPSSGNLNTSWAQCKNTTRYEGKETEKIWIWMTKPKVCHQTEGSVALRFCTEGTYQE